jgi:TolB-like protein
VTDPGKAVFLSYASQDAEAAQNLCAALRAAGIEVWFDQSELRGGDAWDASIRRQIKSCALFIPVISKNTHTRGEGYFRLEWKLAVDRSHLMASDLPFLLPVVVDDTPDEEDRVPDRFREVQWTRLRGGADANAFVDHVRCLLALDATMPAATIARPSALPPSSTVATSARSAPPASRSFMPWIVGGVVIFVTSYFAIERFVASKHKLPAAQAPATVAAPAAIPEKSIAVLPFVDMSEKQNEGYFSDGLSEELIDMLTKVPDLKVPARTSSFYFKGKPTTIRDIAAALGVAHVLEGSVRRSGNTLRITAQLIRVDNGYHLWSETYDRKLDDIFKVQDEIAGAVVKALKVTLLEGRATPVASVKDTEAYSTYLQAKFFFKRDGIGDVQRALEYLHETLRLDPGFAPAWAMLSRATVDEWLRGQLDLKKARQDAQRAADRAMALDRALPEGHIAEGEIEFYCDWDWSAADASFAQALVLDPKNTDALNDRAEVAGTLGRLNDALLLEQRAVVLDPLNADTQDLLGEIYFALERYSEAEAAYRVALTLNPVGYGHSYIAMTFLQRGDAAKALTELQLDPRSARLSVGGQVKLSMIYYALGQTAESDAALSAAEKSNSHDPGWIALGHAYRGEADKYFEWAERAYQQRFWGMTYLKRQPLGKKMLGDPRFKALLRKMNLPE